MSYSRNRVDYPLVVVRNDDPGIMTASRQNKMISKLNPDVALLDIFMPGLDGIKIVSRLRVAGNKTKVILLTGMEDQECVNVALNAGANGFVVKRRMHRDLHKAIETVLSGAVFVSSIGEV